MYNGKNTASNTSEENLQPNLEQKPQPRFGQKPPKTLKDLAMRQLTCQTMLALQSVQNLYMCDQKVAQFERPHNIFSWSLENCLRRLPIPLYWLTMLCRQLSELCLESLKTMTDCDELMSLYRLIMRSYEQHQVEAFEPLKHLSQSQAFLNIEQKLREELSQNQEEMRKELLGVIALNFIRRASLQRFSIKQDFATQNTIVYNIEERYNYSYQEARSDQVDIDCQKTEEAIENEIRRYMQLIKETIYCSQCTMNVTYSDITSLTTRLRDLNAKYDVDFEKITSEIFYKKVGIEKMIARRIFLDEQRIRNREEIVELRLAELLELAREAVERAAALKASKVKRVKRIPNKTLQKSTKSIKKVRKIKA